MLVRVVAKARARPLLLPLEEGGPWFLGFGADLEVFPRKIESSESLLGKEGKSGASVSAAAGDMENGRHRGSPAVHAKIRGV